MQAQHTTFGAMQAVFSQLVAMTETWSGDLAGLEVACMAKLMELGRVVLKRFLESLSPANDFVEGGTRWAVAVDSQLAVLSTFGMVRVERSLFRSSRNGPTRCLVEERAPLLMGLWTEQAARLGALAVAELPMERAEQFFAAAGCMSPSRSSLLRLVGGVSDLWEEEREANEQTVRGKTPIPEEAATVAVSLDGVMVLMTDSSKAELKAAARAQGYADKGPSGWREASVGVVSFYDAEGERLKTRRYGRMPQENKTTTKSWIRKELAHIRASRPDLTVVAIADGAANNWTFLDGLKADHEVVDYFHAAEHLHRHVSKANGASTLDTQDKLRAMRHQLLEEPNGASKVMEDFQQVREKAGTEAISTTKESGKRQPTFFERHKERMNYPELRAKNLPIGSGVTESTCKLAICDRLRRTGMRWSERGGQAVITLRASLVSNTFDQTWNVITQANRVRLAA